MKPFTLWLPRAQRAPLGIGDGQFHAIRTRRGGILAAVQRINAREIAFNGNFYFLPLTPVSFSI
jgi:hypothetical protein